MPRTNDAICHDTVSVTQFASSIDWFRCARRGEWTLSKLLITISIKRLYSLHTENDSLVGRSNRGKTISCVIVKIEFYLISFVDHATEQKLKLKLRETTETTFACLSRTTKTENTCFYLSTLIVFHLTWVNRSLMNRKRRSTRRCDDWHEMTQTITAISKIKWTPRGDDNNNNSLSTI